MSARLRTALLAVVALCVLTLGSVYFWHGQNRGVAAAADAYQTPEEANNVYVRFAMEAYDDVASRYWQKTTDTDLSHLFQLSLAKAAGTSSEPLATSTRSGVAHMLAQAFAGLSTTSEKQLALQTITVALYNLAPTGRDQVLSHEAQTTLQNTVANVHPENDLYGALGLSKGASAAQVNEAYVQALPALAATTSAAGKAQRAEVERAHKILANTTDKSIYDQTGAEPTVFAHIMNAHTLYVSISQIAPTTIAEFASAITNASSTPGLSNLILDVRGNIGGDLGFAQEFLALFLGPNQYGFDLYHQSNLEVQRTANIAEAPQITRFKEIAVLTDAMSQSTAEVISSALKHDHLAYTVGATTRGWGSVEQIIPMQTVIDPNESYALEMVVYLTVRYDGLPIEGNGVVPDVAVGDPHWKSTLSSYFDSSDMIAAIQKAASGQPLK